MQFRSAFQILNGLGAGNIGDEYMMHAFWEQLPPGFHLHVALFGESHRQRQPYPERFRYYLHTPNGIENEWVRDMPGLLAGTTSITDVEGWGWPLSFEAPRLQHFHDLGLPVDAVGVGVDSLVTPEGRSLFARHFLPVRSWTVRDDSGRNALLDLGVDPVRVAVGADFAWLYEPAHDYSTWARDYWQSLGVRTDEPLLVMNLFWQGQGEALPIWSDIASVLDELRLRDGLQIAFLCHECRHPNFDREAAETVQARMTQSSILVPNEYFAPGEVIALLRHATVTVGQRYHYCIASVAAETVTVSLGRAPKTASLNRELGLTACG
jgi:polysaccharide pyruvyl transferase WcaK-like protein